MNPLTRTIAILCAFFFFTSCAGTPGDAGADKSFTLMTTARTAFYAGGPSELVPEGYLEAGTRVRVLSSSGAMTQVQTVTGKNGWVATGDVGPMQERQSWAQ